MKGLTWIAAAACIVALAAGCGKKKDQDQSFRVPDSLLAPIARLELTVDDYHVTKGGVMANADIELRYPSSEIARYVAMKTFEFALDGYRAVSKEIGRPAEGRVVLIGSVDLDEYRFLTRKEWWYYGVISGDSIYLEPFDIMLKRFDKESQRSISQIGITQKLAQLALIKRSGGRLPLWLRESLASRIAGEGGVLKMQAYQYELANAALNPSPAEIESALAEASDQQATRIAFYAAYRMLESLLAMKDVGAAYRFADFLREGKTLDEASREAFGAGYNELIDRIRVDGRKPAGEGERAS